MTCCGVPSWPPPWLGIDTNEALTSELAVLKHVFIDAPNKKKCFLIVEYEGCAFIGFLKLDDVAFCARIATILTKQTGRSIREIGDIDLGRPS
jgi:hypothetical protein